jgi:hypothetical protein
MILEPGRTVETGPVTEGESTTFVDVEFGVSRCAVVRFAHDLNVPPTSNQAERDVRPAKTQQKISGRLTSEDVTRDRYRIYGYLSTATKHGIDQLSALRDAILGRPWMPAPPPPPAPAPA